MKASKSCPWAASTTTETCQIGPHAPHTQRSVFDLHTIPLAAEIHPCSFTCRLTLSNLCLMRVVCFRCLFRCMFVHERHLSVRRTNDQHGRRRWPRGIDHEAGLAPLTKKWHASSLESTTLRVTLLPQDARHIGVRGGDAFAACRSPPRLQTGQRSRKSSTCSRRLQQPSVGIAFTLLGGERLLINITQTPRANDPFGVRNTQYGVF